ncbi:MAG: transketolase [Rhodospirillaceae bacterium]|jgi:transketolase|nr:transketolase [Rhodospirillaceae bacterium]MBT3494413.1 transketolase [Rhodospirillaceae bacterium]MBT3781318.1 transketolase [Rhodospirillaceae bacterium]MBT3978761.1 transketolase [Rhodospirillaceae bacterium]MBT4167032.1 transketolase [Rhodospirillaceae bacterium]
MTSNYQAKLEGLQNDALHIRRNVWRALHAAGSGHMGGSSSAADILAALYFHHLRLRPDEPDWPDRDRFVLSKGHANAALGAALARAGFIDDSVLDQFYAYLSPFGMHPDIKMAGVEMSTGGLGHGLSVAMGMALGARMQGKDFRTCVMIGDGELQEGSNWEGAMAAAHMGLSNLTAILDYNKIQQSGHVGQMMGLEPVAQKWDAFGWAVREIDGHDMAAVVEALDALPFASDKPSMIIAHTIKGKGVSFAEDSFLWHNNLVTDEVYEKALAELGEPS